MNEPLFFYNPDYYQIIGIVQDDTILDVSNVIINVLGTNYVCKKIEINKINDEDRVETNEHITNHKVHHSIEMLREFANNVYSVANANHKYDSKPEFPPLVVHVISELTEAVSAYLYNNMSSIDDIELALSNMDSPLYNDFFKNNLKSKFEDEIADAILILFSIAVYLKMDIATHLILKNHYNKVRNEHSVFNNYISEQ